MIELFQTTKYCNFLFVKQSFTIVDFQLFLTWFNALVYLFITGKPYLHLHWIIYTEVHYCLSMTIAV